MACGGCRRNKSTSSSRNKPKKTTKAVVSKNSLSEADISLRKKKCVRCPFNNQPGIAGRCKKVNRMISRAVADPSFKCPIKRF
jgi:hypothetical protein